MLWKRRPGYVMCLASLKADHRGKLMSSKPKKKAKIDVDLRLTKISVSAPQVQDVFSGRQDVRPSLQEAEEGLAESIDYAQQDAFRAMACECASDRKSIIRDDGDEPLDHSS